MIKNIFIAPSLTKNNFGEITFSTRIDYFKYFEKIKLSCHSTFSLEKKTIKKISKDNDALILCGGGNIFKLEKNKTNFLRDKFEIALVKEFVKKEKPIIAICRGFQLIASMYKNEIIKIKNHVKKRHKVKIIKPDSLIKNNYLSTNSYHEYALIKINKNFRVYGVTNDGSIEIALNKKKKILCLMFHPERQNLSKNEIKKIILNFLYGAYNFSSRSRKKSK